MRLSQILITILSALLLSACGQKSSPKTLEVSAGFALATSFGGGLVVRGYGPNNQRITASSANGSSVNILLPDGTWTFYAVGWDGATPLSGNTHCGKATFNLGSSDTVLKMTIEEPGCSDADFKGPFTTVANASGFEDLRIHSCNHSMTNTTTALTSASSTSALGLLCGSQFPIDYQLHAKSIKVNVGMNAVSPGLESTCISASTANHLSGLRIPTDKIPVRITLFAEEGCEGDTVIHPFPDGLISSSDPLRGFFHPGMSAENSIIVPFNFPRFGRTPFFDFMPALTRTDGQTFHVAKASAPVMPINSSNTANFILNQGSQATRLAIARDTTASCPLTFASVTGLTFTNCKKEDGHIYYDVQATSNCSSSDCSFVYNTSTYYVRQLSGATPRALEILGTVYRLMGVDLSTHPHLLNSIWKFDRGADHTFGQLNHARELLGTDSPMGLFGYQVCDSSFVDSKTISIVEDGQLKVFSAIIKNSTQTVPLAYCNNTNTDPADCTGGISAYDKQVIFRELVNGSYRTRVNMYLSCAFQIGQLETISSDNSDGKYRDERDLLYWNTQVAERSRYEVYREETEYTTSAKDTIKRLRRSFDKVQMVAGASSNGDDFYIWSHEYHRERGSTHTEERVTKREFGASSANSYDIHSNDIGVSRRTVNASFVPDSIYSLPVSKRDTLIPRLDFKVGTGSAPFGAREFNYDYDELVVGGTTYRAIVWKDHGGGIKFLYFNGSTWSSVLNVDNAGYYPRVALNSSGNVAIAWVDGTSVKFNKYTSSVLGTSAIVASLGTLVGLGVSYSDTGRPTVFWSTSNSIQYSQHNGSIWSSASSVGSALPVGDFIIQQSLRVVRRPNSNQTAIAWLYWDDPSTIKMSWALYDPGTIVVPHSIMNSGTITPASNFFSADTFSIANIGDSVFYSFHNGTTYTRFFSSMTAETTSFGNFQSEDVKVEGSMFECTKPSSLTSTGNCATYSTPGALLKPVKAISPSQLGMSGGRFNNSNSIFTPLSTFINIQ